MRQWILYDTAFTNARGPRPRERRRCVLDLQTARDGLALGWVVASAQGPGIRAVHDQLVVRGHAAADRCRTALGAGQERFTIWGEYREKRDELGGAPAAGFDLGPTPRGAYYWFVGYRGVPSLAGLDPLAAAMKLTKEVGVACVPGDNFYVSARRNDAAHGQRYLRFAFCRSLGVLRAAGERLAAMSVKY